MTGYQCAYTLANVHLMVLGVDPNPHYPLTAFLTDLISALFHVSVLRPDAEGIQHVQCTLSSSVI